MLAHSKHTRWFSNGFLQLVPEMWIILNNSEWYIKQFPLRRLWPNYPTSETWKNTTCGNDLPPYLKTYPGFLWGQYKLSETLGHFPAMFVDPVPNICTSESVGLPHPQHLALPLGKVLVGRSFFALWIAMCYWSFVGSGPTYGIPTYLLVCAYTSHSFSLSL